MGGELTDARWGVWALVVRNDRGLGGAKQSVIDKLAEKWIAIDEKARGFNEEVIVKRDDWDKTRILDLCARHGWDFEWMSEDGERRRRANEREVLFQHAGASLADTRKIADSVMKALPGNKTTEQPAETPAQAGSDAPAQNSSDAPAQPSSDAPAQTSEPAAVE